MISISVTGSLPCERDHTPGLGEGPGGCGHQGQDPLQGAADGHGHDSCVRGGKVQPSGSLCQILLEATRESTQGRVSQVSVGLAQHHDD